MFSVTAWLTSTLDGIEAEDGKLAGMVTLMKNDLLTWMSGSLLLLVPDKSNNKLLRDITNPSTGIVIRVFSEIYVGKLFFRKILTTILIRYFSNCT